MRMWLYVINLCMVSRKGISALQLQRELGIGEQNASDGLYTWFLEINEQSLCCFKRHRDLINMIQQV